MTELLQPLIILLKILIPLSMLKIPVFGLWHFNEGSGQYTHDSSVNKRHGVLGISTVSDTADPKLLSESPVTPR